jgi:thiol-disulfide isomerase/thioredoxin
MVTLKFALKLFASAVFACGVQVSECYQSPCFAQDSPAVNAESSAAAVELKGFRGEPVAWPPQTKQVRVVAFLGTGCPLAKLYAGRLQQLSEQYQEKVEFLAVDPNPQDSLEEMAAFAREYKLSFEFARDIGQHLARQLKITRTPQVVLLDESGAIRYQGRVDDQYGVGYQRKETTREDLKLAIDALLAGAQVEAARTEAPGCLISFQRKPSDSAPITYASHVAAILNEHCVRCHREGQIGPFAMSDYEEVAGWAEMIGEVVKDNRMPPWHADPQFGKWANDCSLSPEKKQILLDWVAAGAPPGDLSTVPAPPAFVAGWQVPKTPDMVLKITPEPVKVRAKGDVKYQ